MRRVLGSSKGAVGTPCATALLVVAMAGSAAAQCGGTQLCAPGTGDCAVNAACTLMLPAAGLTIDLGTRRLVITRSLQIEGPAGAGLVIKAGDVLIDGTTISLPGADGTAGNLTILSSTKIMVRNGATIDASANQSAGLVDLQALGGDLSFSGLLKANGTVGQAYGGQIDLFATGNLSVGGVRLDVSGGEFASGGLLTLEAVAGSVTVNLPLFADGGDGGDIDMDAGTTIQTSSGSTFRLNAIGDAGSGGSVALSATGDIVVGGETIGWGSLPFLQTDGRAGGDGADFDVASTSGNVAMNGRIDVHAAAGGFGGGIDFFAGGNLTLSKPLISTSSAPDGVGGDVLLVAGGALLLQNSINVAADLGSGGAIEADADGNVTVLDTLSANGDVAGGSILLAGCAVNVASAGLLSSIGPGTAPAASNTLQASSTMTIAGKLRATTRNLLQYRAAPAPSITGSVTPATPPVLEPRLPCCVNCPVTTTTTTTSTTTTTTSTTTTIRTTTTTVVGSTTTTTVPSICGNRVVTGAEQCDDGNTVAGDCCSPTCTFETVNSSCASDGNPCTRDVCNGAGACTHSAGNAGTTCRAAAGACDQAETCSGTATACPVDAKRTGVCRPGAGVCDLAESCNGTSNDCPADGFAPATTTCRAAASVCDLAETCTGAGPACPGDQLAPPGTSCRAATGVCDVAETCTGMSAACPVDGFLPDGTTCTGNACTGSGTCQGGVCSSAGRSSCGPCETCDPVAGCLVAPRLACRRPVASGKAQIKVKDSLSGPNGDRVEWKWNAGESTSLADFGDPVASNGLTLCIFDRSQPTASLLFRATVPAGGTCGTQPCWTSSGRYFKYSDRDAVTEGTYKMSLVPGAAGRANILFKGRGTGLSQRPFGVPRPPLPTPLTVQLQSESGQCWEANYARAGLRANNGESFSALSE